MPVSFPSGPQLGAPLSSIGNIITNRRPDFDSRSYGYAKLSDLIKATGLFSIERNSPGDGKQAIVYAREKRRAAATARTPRTKAPRAANATGAARTPGAAKAPTAKTSTVKAPAVKTSAVKAARVQVVP